MKKQALALALPTVLILLLLSIAPAAGQPAGQTSAPACAVTHRVASGETLSLLAARYLGSFAAYPQLVEATNRAAATDESYTAITNPVLIQVGQQICVPAGDGEEGQPVTQSSPPAPTATPRPVQPSPIASATVTVTATATPIPAAEHPLTIANMRARSYPGSELVIEQRLAAGVNYARYVASYRSDGLKIYGLLTIPNGDAPADGWPIVLFNHGYIPPEIYRTTERYGAYQDGFARNGYITFKSDYRGHGSSEGEAASGHANPDYTTDVLNALSSLRRLEEADPARVGMWGHSMGGSIVLRSMIVTDTVKVGVIWAGVVASYPDLLNRFELQGVPVPEWFARWRDEFLAAYGTPEENPEFWRAISPNYFLDDLSGPIQLHHTTGDASVPVEYSDVLADQIEAVGGEVEYYRYNGDNHNISANFGAAMARSVAFFDKYLKTQD